jgi:DNA-binding response OmpR family regulator
MEPILVVEDDPQFRQMIRSTLEDEGWTVEVAVRGQQALEWLLRRRPALVLLDWRLSDVDGDVVATGLRTTHGEGIPLVLITADGHAARKAGRVRAFGYLNKPFELDDLISLVRRGLSGA